MYNLSNINVARVGSVKRSKTILKALRKKSFAFRFKEKDGFFSIDDAGQIVIASGTKLAKSPKKLAKMLRRVDAALEWIRRSDIAVDLYTLISEYTKVRADIEREVLNSLAMSAPGSCGKYIPGKKKRWSSGARLKRRSRSGSAYRIRD